MSESFIGFFDILGFKELVERNSHKKLLKIYEEALYFNVNEIAKIGIDIHYDQNAKASLRMIKQFIISDSIIFIQNDLSHRGLFFLILQCKVLLSISMREGIPLRGGISFGEVSIIEKMGTTIVGRGLTDAYKIEASQEWSGAIVDPICFATHPNGKNFQYLLAYYLNEPLLIDYSVPIKPLKRVKAFAINWVDNNLNEKGIISKFTKYNKQLSSEKEHKIVENTIDFVKHAKHINKIRRATSFFRIIQDQFDASINSFENSSIDRICSVKTTDTWNKYLLRSKYYEEIRVKGIISIRHRITGRSIPYSSNQELVASDVINSKLIFEIETNFNAFKRLDKASRHNVIDELRGPWY